MAVGPEPPRYSQEGVLPRRPASATVGLVLGVLGGVAIAFGVVLYAIEPTLLPLALGNLGFGVLGVAAYVGTNQSTIGRAFRGRSTPLLALEVVIAVGVVAMVVIVNLLAAKTQKEWDLTRDKLFTLQPQSIEIARRLDQPITVYAFFRKADPEVAKLEETLRLYRQHTTKLELQVVDPDQAAPELIERYELTAKSEKIVLQGPLRYTKIRTGNENELTNGLLKLLERPVRKVGYLTGHREPDPESKTDEDALGEAIASLRAEGYDVAEVGLAEPPKDVELLIVVAPRIELIPAELDALRTYLTEGGRLLVLLDPLRAGGLPPLLRELGAEVGSDLVVDPSPQARAAGFSEATLVLRGYEAHPITGPLEGQVTIFHLVRSVAPRLGAADATTLLQTGETSWAEADPRASGPYQLDPIDSPGPVPLAVAVETHPFGRPGPAGPTRLVVFGDADFARNRLIAAGANRDLWVNAANWLLGEDDRVTVRPKQRQGDRLPLTEMQHYGIMFFSVNLMPLVILGFGFSVWALRRRQ